MTDFFSNLDWSVLINPLMRLIPLLICVTVHELAHGYAAFRLGDPTAKLMGRLTLNPIKHIDPVGAFMILIVGFGWAKPVPVDMLNFKNPKKDMAITALAGPVSNIILAIFVLMFLILISGPLLGGSSSADGEYFLKSIFNIAPESFIEFVYQVIVRTAWLSIILAIFNMLPIPPLDGSKILFSFLPDRLYARLMVYERYGFIILLALLFLPRFLNLPDILGQIVIRSAIFLMSSLSFLFGIIPEAIHTFLLNQ